MALDVIEPLCTWQSRYGARNGMPTVVSLEPVHQLASVSVKTTTASTTLSRVITHATDTISRPRHGSNAVKVIRRKNLAARAGSIPIP